MLLLLLERMLVATRVSKSVIALIELIVDLGLRNIKLACIVVQPVSFFGDHEDGVEVLFGKFVVLRVDSPVVRQDLIVDPFEGDIGVNI